jgi:hypothetical protein
MARRGGRRKAALIAVRANAVAIKQAMAALELAEGPVARAFLRDGRARLRRAVTRACPHLIANPRLPMYSAGGVAEEILCAACVARRGAQRLERDVCDACDRSGVPTTLWAEGMGSGLTILFTLCAECLEKVPS